LIQNYKVIGRIIREAKLNSTKNMNGWSGTKFEGRDEEIMGKYDVLRCFDDVVQWDI
jgi:hypothetical protein